MKEAQRISTTELRNNLSEVLDDVENGEEFVVERHGEPVALLQSTPRRGATLAEIEAKARAVFQGLSDEERAAYLTAVRSLRSEQDA